MVSKQSDLRIPHSLLIVAIAAASLALPACQKREKPAPANTSAAPAVVGVELGNAVQSNKRVTQPMTTFSPTDTIYVAIMTEGNAPAATLTTRWTYEDGQPVEESSQSLVMSGPATTDFHIMKPGGWPVGVYKVEILLDGTAARAVGFTVR
jgi:hypothetical protein